MRRRDVDKSRDDLAAFSKLVGWPLARWQAASLRLEARTTYVVGPRESQPASAPITNPASGARGMSVVTLTRMPSANPITAPTATAAPIGMRLR